MDPTVEELTPFEADAEAQAELNEWFDIFYSVDRFMEMDHIE